MWGPEAPELHATDPKASSLRTSFWVLEDAMHASFRSREQPIALQGYDIYETQQQPESHDNPQSAVVAHIPSV